MPPPQTAAMGEKLRTPGPRWPMPGHELYRTNVDPTPKDPREFVCGWGAASINVTLTFPLNKMIFRQQLYGVNTRAALAQLQKEGLVHLYRGLMSPFLQKTTSLSLMFGMYDACFRILYNMSPDSPYLATKASAAFLAGSSEAILAPFERIQSLMQDRSYHHHWKNTLHAFKDVHSQHGILEFYRGLGPVLMRNGPSSVLFFLGRDEIRALFKCPSTRSGEIAINFVSGAFLGATISTIFYPVNVVKTHMQSTTGGRFVSLRESFQIVFEKRGRSWQRIFYGAQWNFTRSLISWGVINASYELLKEILYTDKENDES